jgi:hypothetical protein
MFTTTLRRCTLAGLLTLGPAVTLPAASVADESRFAPIESISMVFGSKHMSGYFLQDAGLCDLTLMLYEQGDGDAIPSTSATRVRLLLRQHQIAGLDSEEGASLNFTCGEGGSTLLVDAGETAKLTALQRLGTARYAVVPQQP